MAKNNIVLIGMPGSGKSTVGVVLAKTLGYKFIDTDLLIQEQDGRILQDIINESGNDTFQKIEEDVLCGLDCHKTVISTGGSAVYSEPAMKHLREISTVFYLDVPLHVIKKRLYNIKTRGITMGPGETIELLLAKRKPLYKNHADFTIDALDKNVERIVEEIIEDQQKGVTVD